MPDQIDNPVLAGFHPDPCLLRVDRDYYLVTSTFEWLPGVQVHHSRDLVRWRPLGGLLAEPRLVELSGCGDSGGVWAPSLSYADGRFHLVYTVVTNHIGPFKDTRNLLVTAPRISGPWSDPVPLHARGFDPSLFHDRDGTSWLLTMRTDWQPGRPRFAGIEIQRYDRAAGRLTGAPEVIFTGTAAGFTEGPHLYRRGNWYYLVTAEGGTGYRHQVTVARSRDIGGPYEPDPAGPVLTARGRPGLPLQRVGHASLVETAEGEWYLAHLASRPTRPLGPSVLGRETALQRCDWTADGWLRVPDATAALSVPAPVVEPVAGSGPARVTAPDQLDPPWLTLRRHAGPTWVTRSGDGLQVSGGGSPLDRWRPSLIARPMTGWPCELRAQVRFRPASIHHLAGVTAYYNTRNWHYLCVSGTDDGHALLRVLTADLGDLRTYPEVEVDLGDADRVGLRVRCDGTEVSFAYNRGAGWVRLPLALDAEILSDEHATETWHGRVEAMGFTGAVLGVWVHDLTGAGRTADFTELRYTGGGPAG